MQQHVEAKLRFNHMRLLAMLAETGSMRRAAEAMHLSQAALSKALKEIERTLGVALYDRTSRGLRMTPAGTLATEYAIRLLNELQALTDETRRVSRRAERRLRLGSVPFLSARWLPAIMAQLRRDALPLHIEHMEARTDALLALLQEGQLDVIAVPLLPQAWPLIAESGPFRHESIFTTPCDMVCHPDSPFSDHRIAWEDLAQANWVLPSPRSQLRRLFDEEISRRRLSVIEPVLQSDSLVASVAFAKQGLGIAIAPRPVLQNDLQAGSLVRLALDPQIEASVVLMFSKFAQQNPHVEWLRNVAAAAADEVQPGIGGFSSEG
ncbi:MAG: LysR family transcriptional regulator [Pigmentiphaga sp.]